MGYEALKMLSAALEEAGGRRKAFTRRRIEMTDRDKERLCNWQKRHGHGGISRVIGIDAFDIVKGRKTEIGVVLVLWRLTNKVSSQHYFTKDEFNKAKE